MLPDLQTLLKLQDRDQAILKIQAMLKRIPQDEEKANARLADDTANVERCKASIQANEVALKNLEIDAQTRQDTIVKLKAQQYETRKNEEFQALGHEIERYGQEVSDLETQELELMEKADELKAKLQTASESLTATQKLVDEELGKLKERKDTSQEQLDALEKDRTEISARIDEELLSIYDRLLKVKGDAAIVPLAEGKCQGCHMKITTSTELHVKAGKELTHCEQCSRILYLEEE